MQQLEITMINEKKQSKPTSADPNLLMETELEADPILKLSESRVSRLQILIGGLVAIVIMGAMLWALYKHF
jgi:hypothetical protein